jgi:hypothetical protein
MAGGGIYGFKRNYVTDELAALVQSNSDVWFWDTESPSCFRKLTKVP